MTDHASLSEYLHNVGIYIADRIGPDQQPLIAAVQQIWDGIYQSGVTAAKDAPPRPVSPQDYIQGIQEGYEKGHQDGREEAANVIR